MLNSETFSIAVPQFEIIGRPGHHVISCASSQGCTFYQTASILKIV